MKNSATLHPSRGLAITYLVHLSIASPSGGRSEIENLNVIKKIREGFLDYPYASSQAIKRALRDTLKGLGYPVSPVINSSPAKTIGDPINFIDDDLFGYMDASSKKTGNSEVDKLNGIRKSVVSMTPLLSLKEFQDNVDFGANMMGLKTGGNPMPYETEVHRGWYRISLYIELDRIGTGDGFINNIKSVSEISKIDELSTIEEEFDYVQEKGKKYTLMKKIYHEKDKNIAYKRAKALLDAIRFLAPSGRSSNWLIDLTPKLLVGAYVNGARTPFLECPLLDESVKDGNVINGKAINTVNDTFSDGFVENAEKKPCFVVGYRDDLIEKHADSKYLFSWDEIPGEDDERIIEFLKDELKIEWAKTENISKIDDGKTIIVSNNKKSLSLKLNDEKTKVNLKIKDGRVDEFTVKTENGKLNIYDSDIDVMAMKQAFDIMDEWLQQHFQITNED